MVLFLFA